MAPVGIGQDRNRALDNRGETKNPDRKYSPASRHKSGDCRLILFGVGLVEIAYDEPKAS